MRLCSGSSTCFLCSSLFHCQLCEKAALISWQSLRVRSVFLPLVLHCICDSQIQIVSKTVGPWPFQGPDCGSNIGSIVGGYSRKFFFIELPVPKCVSERISKIGRYVTFWKISGLEAFRLKFPLGCNGVDIQGHVWCHVNWRPHISCQWIALPLTAALVHLVSLCFTSQELLF